MAVKKSKAPDVAGDIGKGRHAARLNVVLSIAVAAALLVVVNVISAVHGWRADPSSFKSARLSQSSQRILAQAQGAIRLTSLYTSDKPDSNRDEYLPKVRDLLDEMRGFGLSAGREIEVVHVSNDRQKARTVENLRQRLGRRTANQQAAIDDYLKLADETAGQLEKLAATWQAQAGAGWLGRMGVATQVNLVLTQSRDELRQSVNALRSAREGSLPNYAQMTQDAAEQIKTFQERLEQIRTVLRELTKLPEKAGKARPEIAKAAAAATAAGAKAAEVAKAPGDDLAAALDRLARDARGVADAADSAREALEQLDQNTGGLARAAQGWVQGKLALPETYTVIAMRASSLAEQAAGVRGAAVPAVQKQFLDKALPYLPALHDDARKSEAAVKVVLDQLMVLDEGTMKAFGEINKDDYLNSLLGPVAGLRQQVKAAPVLDYLSANASLLEKFRQAAKRQALAEAVGPELGDLLGAIDRLNPRGADIDAVIDLAKKVAARVEPAGKAPTVQADAEAAEGLKTVAKLAEQLQKSPEDLGKQGDWVGDVQKDNVVIVEVGEDKVGVIGFDEVWPLEPRSMGPRAAQDKDKRIFNGDAAIAAKVLELSAEPFGEVVLTFFENIPPQYMWQQMPPTMGPIPTIQLKTLRQRLEKANLKVIEWNLMKEINPPWKAAAEGAASASAPASAPAPGKRPERVLLVLPPADQPPPPMGGGEPPPGWSPQHEKAINDAIADGAPAIFLIGYLREQMGMMGSMGPPNYALAGYLREEWGLDVKTAQRVVQAQPDAINPGKWEIIPELWLSMPLANFSDHPAGAPLKARRVAWVDVCPVVPAKENKAQAVLRDILTAPAGAGGLWATSQADELMQQLMQGECRNLSIQKDDLAPPFGVIVQSERELGGRKNQVIVMGTGMSFMDWFLSNPVRRIEGKNIVAEPPPSTDADLVVNAVYHLIGRGEYIGAGPSLNQPIGLISPTALAVMQIGFIVLLPLLVIGIGIAVMVVRRREGG